ncbi:MAG: hypothetical protein DMG93_19970 [Acidobacteria bacterium]|nr:MAG: hypothetical protein DMG93_19970 [Acidobacteriota bacterium]
MVMGDQGAGSVLIYAAGSGNPEIVKEILRYHPNLEAKDREGKTAIFAAADYRNSDKEGACVECVRLLAQAGASVNARDKRRQYAGCERSKQRRRDADLYQC